MTPDRLFSEFENGFPGRKFSAGLLIAFIDLFKKLDVPSMHARNLDDVLAAFPRQMTTSRGKRANTLIVAVPAVR